MSDNSPYDMNDEVLISSLANGDSHAIRHIYKTFYPTVEKMVFKMNGSMDDAYDTFQDSVTILYEKAKNILVEFLTKNKKISAAQYRDLLNTNRKTAIALLEHFDMLKLTKRIENDRILLNLT